MKLLLKTFPAIFMLLLLGQSCSVTHLASEYDCDEIQYCIILNIPSSYFPTRDHQVIMMLDDFDTRYTIHQIYLRLPPSS